MVGIEGEPDPAAIGEGLVGLPEALGREDRSILPATALGIAGLVQRLRHALADVGSTAQEILDEVRRQVGIGRQVGQALDLQHLGQDIGEVVDGAA